MAGLRSKFIEQLSCAICHEIFTTPKQLHCLHRFCQTCIQGYINRKAINPEIGVSCPTCRKLTKIAYTDGNIRDKALWAETFPTDFETQSLCVMLREDSDTCPEHENQQVLGYCEVCQSCFCEQCNHKCFRFTPLEKAVTQRRKALNTRQANLAEITDRLRQDLIKTTVEKDDLKKNLIASTDGIKREFATLRNLVDLGEKNVLKQLDESMKDTTEKLFNIEREKYNKLRRILLDKGEISNALEIRSSARFLQKTKRRYEDFTHEPFQRGAFSNKTDITIKKSRLLTIEKSINGIVTELNRQIMSQKRSAASTMADNYSDSSSEDFD